MSTSVAGDVHVAGFDEPGRDLDVRVGLDLCAVRDGARARPGASSSARGFRIHELQAADLRQRLGPLPLRHDRYRAVGEPWRSACTAARPPGRCRRARARRAPSRASPSALTFKLPPREYASLPSRACTASQPSPSIATSRTSPVCTSAPCERSKPTPVATVLMRLAIARPFDGRAPRTARGRRESRSSRRWRGCATRAPAPA